MEYKFVIPGRLPDLNEYSNACRGNAFAANKVKKDAETLICCYINKLVNHKLGRIHLIFHWIEKNRFRDKDNICFAKKFVLDALQKKNVIKNDGWKQIAGFEDKFSVDPSNPRVEVTIQVLVEGENELF